MELCNQEKTTRAPASAGRDARRALERRDAEFDLNIPYISEIKLCVGAYLGGGVEKTLKIRDDGVLTEVKGLLSFDEVDGGGAVLNKSELLQSLSELHIGRWRSRYDLSRASIFVCDGVYWSLEVCYSNGERTRKFSGSNRFPDNFERLLKIFDLEMP